MVVAPFCIGLAHFFSYVPDTSLMAERKRLPAFIGLAMVLAETAAVALDYWGYVMSATYTQVEVQVTGFTLHDSRDIIVAM